jgi:hypothetical protein
MSHPSAGVVDLDSFLTLLESQLRAPFATLDIVTAAKDDDYLANLGAVLPRTEKVTQLRALLGLLAGEPSHDAALLEIVRATQGAAVYDEWVRVLAGVVEEVLLAEEEDDDKQDGEVNETNLTKTCREILDRLRKLESNSTDDNDYAPVEDADPLFVPYHYHLLPPPLLQTVLPETSVHTHFQVHAAAEILHLDTQLEKAKEEPDPRGAAPQRPPPSSVGVAATTVVRPDTTTRKPAVVRPKSSMFLPSVKPALGTASKSTGLRPRQAALSLVGKGRRGARAAPDARGGKMKLLTEAPPPVAPPAAERPPLTGRKRSHPATVEPRKSTAVPAVVAAALPEPVITEPAAGDLAAAALRAYQQQPRRDSKPGATTKQQDWRQLLQQRSNRVSEDDRRRIHQFFVERVNPTPEVTTYKMKLHEERTTDAATGQPVKETYYLELDYTNFTSTQTKKVKRYGSENH